MVVEKEVTEITDTNRGKESFFAGESIEHENNDGEVTGANRQKVSALAGVITDNDISDSQRSDEGSQSNE